VAHARCLLACGAATHADDKAQSLLRFALELGHTQVAQLIAEHEAKIASEVAQLIAEHDAMIASEERPPSTTT
jgi:hypothetical protein